MLVILPRVIGDNGVSYTVRYSNDYPGGLSERVLVGNGGHYKIPDGVNPYHAAVTEPLATGYNSVLRAEINPTGGAIITGAGTVGLGAVIALATRGIHPIVVSDPSEARRNIALKYGAHAVVGHLFGAIGILASDSRKWFCLPLFMNLQDGVQTILGWKKSASGSQTPSHVVQMIEQGFEVAKSFGQTLLLLDRYFLSVPALERLNACW